MAEYRGTAGEDSILGGMENDVIWGLAGNDRLEGRTGNDTIHGGGGDDLLWGRSEDDYWDYDGTLEYLFGDAGNDSLHGSRARDILDGGIGDDVIDLTSRVTFRPWMDGQEDGLDTAAGGAGADRFILCAASNGTQRDRLLDFNAAEGDRIGFSSNLPLSVMIFRGSLDPAHFVYGAALPDDQLGPAIMRTWFTRQGTKTYLLTDTDGDLVFDEQDLVVELAGTSQRTLTAAAFVDGTFIIEGSDANDQMTGGDANDEFIGGKGNDALTGLAGNDHLYGGEGDDRLVGGIGTDFLVGGLGADVMIGGDTGDFYYVDNVDDQIIEFADDTPARDTVRVSVDVYRLPEFVEQAYGDLSTGQTLIGTRFKNYINGGNGDDIIDGGANQDILEGDYGNDVYYVDNFYDLVNEFYWNGGTDEVRCTWKEYELRPYLERLVFLGTGDFTGTGNDLDNFIRGGAGNDTLSGAGGVDQLFGLDGNDTLSGNGFFYGGNGDDSFFAAPMQCRMVGGTGIDTAFYTYASWGIIVTLATTAVQDTGWGTHELLSIENLSGSLHADQMGGNTLANRIDGKAGDDVLNGAGGRDVLIGAAGHDVLDGGTGIDTLDGGGGNDTYFIDNAGDVIVDTAGIDLVKSAVGYRLGDGLEDLELLGAAHLAATGNVLNNRIDGNRGQNVIDGGAGDDTLHGREGNDTLSGGIGADVFHGGAGRDVLTGGAGRDLFHFDTALDGSADRITDYLAGGDFIYLDRSVFRHIQSDGRLSALYFQNGTRARDADDRILYDQATGKIFYDSDGKGTAAAILFAEVSPGTELSNLDFIAYTG